MRVLKTIERDWRNALRRLIRKRGLVDTGLMVESVEIWAEIDDFGVLEINIEAVDYLKYLYEPFNLGEFVYEDNIVSRAYMEWTQEKAKDFPFIDWKRKFKPRIIVNLPE
jgi:hypothetical protein